MSQRKRKGHYGTVIEVLLRELDELRKLDLRRNAHAPGSAAHDATTLEVDRRTRQLMDRFRDLKTRRKREATRDDALTRPIDAKGRRVGGRSALLN